MKSLLLIDPILIPEDYRWETVPVPAPGPKEVLVKVAAVGICAGDAKCFAGADRFWGKSTLAFYNSSLIMAVKSLQYLPRSPC